MIRASVDIGTNSVKLSVGDVSGREISMIEDVSTVTKLGEGLAASGNLSSDAVKRTSLAVLGYVNRAKELKACDIIIAGTMALRSAKNSFELIKSIKQLTNIDVRTISGEEEAKLSFAAALYGIEGARSSKVVTFDTGGGSTEFVFGENGAITYEKSINIGAIRLTEKYFAKTPVSEEELKIAQREITEEISKEGISSSNAILVAMGGNVTSMAAVKEGMEVYDAKKIQGYLLTRDDADKLAKKFAFCSLEERKKIKGLEAARAEIITAGACIVRGAMEVCRSDSLTVSDLGLRRMLLLRE